MSAIMEMLLRLKLSRYITEKVPMMEKGSAMAGIMVAEKFRRKRKMTMMTRARVAAMVNWISWKASRIFLERSPRTPRCTLGGICAWKTGMRRLTLSVTSMVLEPGWRMTERLTPMVPSLPYSPP